MSNNDLAELNTSLTASNNQPFRFDYQNGEYGYVTESGGADTFRPFKEEIDFSSAIAFNFNIWNTMQRTTESNYSYLILSDARFLNLQNVLYKVTLTCNGGTLLNNSNDRIKIYKDVPAGSVIDALGSGQYIGTLYASYLAIP